MTTLKGQYTIIDVTDGRNGSNIWTTTEAPVNDRISLDDLVGPDSAEKQVGDIVFYSTFKYYISRIESGYATVSEKVDFKGEDGEDGTSVTISNTSVTYQVGESGTEKPTGEWLPTIPPVDEGKYLWTKTEVEYSPSGSTESYSVSYNGTNGNTGWSHATITLYQRSDDDQTKFNGGTLNYEFSSGELTGVFGSWERSIPDGDEKLWAITASAFSQDASDDIDPDEWTPPVVLSENGADGLNGLTMLTVILYQRKSTKPSNPTAPVTYNFTEKTISGEGVGDWSLSFPSGNDPLWVTSATASAMDDDKDVISPSEWSPVQKLVENGEKGDPGTKVVNATYYKQAESTSTINSWATSDTSFDNAEVYQSDIDKIKVGDTVYIAVQNSDTGKTDRVIRVCTAKSATRFDSAGAGSGLGVLRDGGNGANGYSSAVVYMYKRSASEPSKPTGSFTYTFSTGALFPSSKDGWTQSVPTGEDKVWQIVRGVVGQNSTATFLGEDFTTPSVISENGTKGADGQSIVNVILYKRSASTPSSVTSSTTYSWRQGEQPTIEGAGLNGWTLAMPTGTDPVYMISATATAQWIETSGAYFSDTIDAEEWSTPNLLAQKGEDGTTFKPSVDSNGNISWTNDGGKANPPTQNIKGPKGDIGLGSKFFGTREWTQALIDTYTEVGYETTWNQTSPGVATVNGDTIYLTITNTTTKQEGVLYILVTAGASASQSPTGKVVSYVKDGDKGNPGANAQDFSINVSPATFSTLSGNRKYYVKDAQTISCTCRLNNISGKAISWSITSGSNGRASINSSTGIISISKGNWSNTPVTAPTLTVRCTVADFGYKEVTVCAVPLGGEEAVYAKGCITAATAKAYVEDLYGNACQDDHYLDDNQIPYRLGPSLTGEVLTSSHSIYPTAMSSMMVDAFSAIPNDSVIKANWAYVLNLAANTAVINELFSQNLVMKDPGVIKSDNFEEGVKGYRLTAADGVIKSYGADMNHLTATDANISGNFTHTWFKTTNSTDKTTAFSCACTELYYFGRQCLQQLVSTGSITTGGSSVSFRLNGNPYTFIGGYVDPMDPRKHTYWNITIKPSEAGNGSWTVPYVDVNGQPTVYRVLSEKSYRDETGSAAAIDILIRSDYMSLPMAGIAYRKSTQRSYLKWPGDGRVLLDSNALSTYYVRASDIWQTLSSQIPAGTYSLTQGVITYGNSSVNAATTPVVVTSNGSSIQIASSPLSFSITRDSYVETALSFTDIKINAGTDGIEVANIMPDIASGRSIGTSSRSFKVWGAVFN